jgi:TM2 domain-containing membrane protein YozV
VRRLVSTVLGLGLFAGGLTWFGYGLAQTIENGSCGTDKYGRTVGPPCPSGTGALIALMILGVFLAVGGSGLFSTRGGFAARGILGGVGRLLFGLFGVGIAAAVFGIVDVHADDTRPGYEIVITVLVLTLVPAIPALLRRQPAGTPVPALAGTPLAFATAPPTPTRPPPREPATTAKAEDVASRLRQLEQLKASGLLSGDEYVQRRKQILAEL